LILPHRDVHPRQTTLMRRSLSRSDGSLFLASVIYQKIARQIQSITVRRNQPILAAAKSPLLGKAAQQNQTRNDQLWTARPAGDVRGRSRFLEGGRVR